MADSDERALGHRPIEASAPCRVDMGGTLDLSTLSYPLAHLEPCTFNLALDLRTRVRLLPYRAGRVRVSSIGFESEDYPVGKAPFDGPLGLMFAIAAHFGAEKLHIEITSASPPRSALGGSSVAAVALVAALARWRGPSDARPLSRTRIALSAHAIESSLAGVPCGMQDQLAAAYGGSHAWYWRPAGSATPFAKRTVLKGKHLKGLESNLLVAYCGLTHESSRINRMWVEQFVAGLRRDVWCEIVRCTRKFVDALSGGDLEGAVGCMNREMALRRDLTPEVLDPTGERLVTTALQNRCGARIAGAGGGGCLWALGQAEDIHRLRTAWQAVLASQPDARLLATRIDTRGLQ